MWPLTGIAGTLQVLTLHRVTSRSVLRHNYFNLPSALFRFLKVGIKFNNWGTENYKIWSSNFLNLCHQKNVFSVEIRCRLPEIISRQDKCSFCSVPLSPIVRSHLWEVKTKMTFLKVTQHFLHGPILQWVTSERQGPKRVHPSITSCSLYAFSCHSFLV